MFKVLCLYPNIQSEQMPPPAVALFSALLKREGFGFGLFDTTDYEIRTDFVNSENSKMATLTVRPFQPAQRQKKTTDAFEDWEKKVQSFNPDLVMVTATENMFPMAINFLSRTHKTGVPVILGGVFATFAPELAMRWQEIDMVCVGEGERVLVELCRKMSRGEDFSKIPGLWLKSGGEIIRNTIGPPVSKDENPLPDFSVFANSRFFRPMAGRMRRIFPVETHAGCPYKCSFCNSPGQDALYEAATGKPFFRKLSMERVRKEILFYRDVWKAEYIFFWADTFFAWSKKEFDAFCEMYSDIRLPFWCQTRPETVTEERIRQLKEVGIHRLGFGIEHGNERYRKEVVRREYSNQLVIDRMRIPNNFGIPYSVNNIIGFPCETRELVFDTIELNRRIQADTRSCSIFVPFCGTELRQMAINHGFIKPDTICPTNSDDSVLSMPPPFLSQTELKGLRRTFVMYVGFPKERWGEIARAEALTSEGDEIHQHLSEEFVQTFFAQPETAIEKINATA